MTKGRNSEGRADESADDAPSGARGRLFDLWRSLSSARSDTEHEVGIGRIGFLLVVLVWSVLHGHSVVAGLASLTSALTLVAIVFAVALLVHVVRNPGVSTLRRHLSVVCDQLYLCLMMAVMGEQGVWLLPALLIVCVGAALRYGRNYSFVASAAGAFGLVLVYYANQDYWHHARALMGSWLTALIVVPAYVAALGARLEALSQTYRQRARKMQKAALRDQLTGLANRAYFRRILERAMERAQAGEQSEGFAILYCDLDGFKGVNDTHGHHVGDLLLKQVASTLGACVRGSDTVARLGGDEFAIYLKGIRDTDIAKRIGANIVERVKAINRIEGRPISVSCSVGITLVAAPLAEDEQLERVLSRADEAMYQAKRAGKNQFYLQWAA